VQFKLIAFALIAALAPNIHAASEPIPLDLIELLGEVDDSDAALEKAMTETEQAHKTAAKQTKPDAPRTQQTGGKQ
jgi:hypothetical protein